eukprot:8082575-Pyramimonas_sp.AAC.1
MCHRTRRRHGSWSRVLSSRAVRLRTAREAHEAVLEGCGQAAAIWRVQRWRGRDPGHIHRGRLA